MDLLPIASTRRISYHMVGIGGLEILHVLLSCTNPERLNPMGDGMLVHLMIRRPTSVATTITEQAYKEKGKEKEKEKEKR